MDFFQKNKEASRVGVHIQPEQDRRAQDGRV